MAKFRARKTPSAVYPADPPKTSSTVEMLYHAIDSSLLESFTAARKDRIVTSQIFYKPGILAVARVVFEGTRWAIYHEREVVRIVPFADHPHVADWSVNLVNEWDHAKLRTAPEGVCFYIYEAGHEFSQERFDELQDDYVQYLLTNETLELTYNPHLKIYKKMDEDDEQFYQRCLDLSREKYDQEKRNLQETILRQEERLKEKLQREVIELGSDPTHLAETGVNQPVPMTNQEEMDAKESMVTIEDIRKQLAELESSKEVRLNEFEENLRKLASEQKKDLMRANLGNVKILRFALIWLPYTEFVLQEGDVRRLELIQSF